MSEIISERKIMKLLEDHPARCFTVKKMNETLNVNELSLQTKMRQLHHRGIVARMRKENGKASNAYHYTTK